MNLPRRPVLADQWECFEGIIPSVVVTAARDGTPNVAYISHVFYIDEDHVALSNQFMSKTVSNIRENPRLQVLVVNGRTGRQLILDLVFEREETSGPLFDILALQVTAVAAHTGMDQVMRLRSADIYRVLSVEAQVMEPETDGAPDEPLRGDRTLFEAAALSLELARQDDLDRAIDLALDGVVERLRIAHCMLFLADPERRVLTAIASRGYSRQGTGAEVRWGDGVVGMAAARAQTLRFSCVGRSFLYIDNVRSTGLLSPDPSRTIPMPGLEAPQSLIAVPMLAGGEIRGLVFAESAGRLAFAPTDEQALGLIAAQLASAVALSDAAQDVGAARTGTPAAPLPLRSPNRAIRVRHHAYDDSVFIDDAYLIKGVPGRLLWRMLRLHEAEARTEFTNREFRLDASLKLPDFKDNLETRLLLLARRLAENPWPIRIRRTGRGRVSLELDGRLDLREE